MADMVGCRHPFINHDTENTETFDALISAGTEEIVMLASVLKPTELVLDSFGNIHAANVGMQVVR